MNEIILHQLSIGYRHKTVATALSATIRSGELREGRHGGEQHASEEGQTEERDTVHEREDLIDAAKLRVSRGIVGVCFMFMFAVGVLMD